MRYCFLLIGIAVLCYMLCRDRNYYTLHGMISVMTSSNDKQQIQLDETSSGSCVSVVASVILLDIEGTTTSISFVKNELFPYVTRNVRTYLSENWDSEQTQEDIEALYLLSLDDLKKEVEGVVPVMQKDNPKQDVLDSVVANIAWQMSEDRKSTALKQLQGHIWSTAYEKGEVKGHLYPEVAKTIQKWNAEGRRVGVYSSGSVAAQKLLFKYSVDGDLSKYIEDYFDTKVGAKREAKSYMRIADLLKTEPSEVLFLTDIYEEAEAAQEAGMNAVIINRPGNKPFLESQRDTFKTVDNFNQLLFDDEQKLEIPEKRRKKEDQ